MTAYTGTSTLTRSEFNDTAELLSQLNRSRSALVRRNTIIAWAELIARTDDADLQRQAVGKLIDTALAHGDDPSVERSIRSIAAKELIALDEALVAEAKRRLRGEIRLRNGADRARCAAELALVLVSRTKGGGLVSGWRSVALTIGSYFSLLRLSLTQWLLIIRDGLGFLLLGTLIGAIVLTGAMELIGSDLLTPDLRGTLIGYAGIQGAIVLPFAAVTSIFTVPSATMRGASLLLDALCLALITFTLLFVFAMIDAGTSLNDLPYAAASGVFTSRIVSNMLDDGSGMAWIKSAAAGWIVGYTTAYLMFAFVLVNASGDAWMIAMAVVTGATIGCAWADYRGGPHYINLPLGRTDGMWRAVALSVCGLACLAFGASLYQFRVEIVAAKGEALKRLLAPSRTDNDKTIKITPCPSSQPVRISPVKLGVYYAVVLCPEQGLRVTVALAPSLSPVQQMRVEPAYVGVLLVDAPALRTLESATVLRFQWNDVSAEARGTKAEARGTKAEARDTKTVHVCVTNMECPQVTYNRSYEEVMLLFGRAWDGDELINLFNKDIRFDSTGSGEADYILDLAPY